MKVLFLSSGNSQFGVSPFIKSQGDSLIKAGVTLKYFLIQGKGFIGYIKTVFKLRYNLNEDPVDLIHAHYGLCGWVAYLAKPKKLPIVLSYMGSDILPVIKGKVKKNAPLARLCRALQNRVDHIIVKSENLKEVLKRKQSISIIPNGVDLHLFKPLSKEDCRKRLGLENKKKIILFLGNTNEAVKNYPLLKAAVNLVLPTNITLLHPYPIQSEQVPIYINATDLLAVPSISEGSPNVVKEAMACNCPIVATDVGNMRWLVGDTPGCFITSFSPDDMALKIKMALDFCKRTTGRERIINLGLDGESIAKRIVAIYETVLKLTK